MVKVKKLKVNNIFTKSSFKGYSFVINPYTGCTHSCKYCFACFIQQFTKHIGEDWGSFIDIKQWKGKITKNIYDKKQGIVVTIGIQGETYIVSHIQGDIIEFE